MSSFGGGTGFGQQQQVISSSNPFTSPPNPSSQATQSTTTMFGSSSNVVTTNNNSNATGGFGTVSSSTGGSWGGLGANTSNSHNNNNNNNNVFGSGFGSSSDNPFSSSTMSLPPSSTSGGERMASDDDMDSGTTSRRKTGYHQRKQSQSISPFAIPSASSSISPIPEGDNEDGGGRGMDSGSGGDHNSEEARLKAKMEEKKRQLQAKIEEKKRRLAERQNRKNKQDDESGRRSRSPTPPREQQSLAERNAQRFSRDNQQTTASRALLPADIRQKKQHDTAALSSSINPVPETEREDLENAVSLVGICPYMCPDDELIRRQQENDIQALEVPLPGTIHPDGWTLRDTAVKRFRRSAADYKLDVPEWVRPPDILERTCSYLEEWIMERDRQGPDTRFPEGATPPPLDVYQFIWDRTRMIRKDFILQNYVGTGGNCDARAVRCHERIARWHVSFFYFLASS